MEKNAILTCVDPGAEDFVVFRQGDPNGFLFMYDSKNSAMLSDLIDVLIAIRERGFDISPNQAVLIKHALIQRLDDFDIKFGPLAMFMSVFNELEHLKIKEIV